ncbi:MAG: hypothetical protein HFE98_02050 [Ruminiclostridium sp.]|jgi:hypothetical protein|nr:hypothetical protein [Ruminiclostridium sp.]MCI9466487.1 hypothetical protein [Ruminiclostridium sp.]
METRFPLENGHLLCTQMGERVRLYMEVRTTATGLCRGLLLGENGDLDLGPMLPEGGCLRLERSFLVETLKKKGCWPITGARLVRPVKPAAGTPPKGWSRDLGLGALFPHDPALAQAAELAPRPLYRPRPQGFQLAWPWDPEAPFPLPPVFCFARVQALGDRPYLVFQFQTGGIPRIEE